MPDKVLWDVNEVAAALGLTPASVYHRVSEGTLPYVKIGSLVRFRPQEITRWASRLTPTSSTRRAPTATTNGRRRTRRR